MPSFIAFKKKISEARLRRFNRSRRGTEIYSSSSHRRDGAHADVDRMLSALRKAVRRAKADAHDTTAAKHLCDLAAECAGFMAEDTRNPMNPMINGIQEALLVLSHRIQENGYPETMNGNRTISVGNIVRSERDLPLRLATEKTSSGKTKRKKSRHNSDSRLSGERGEESFVDQYRARWAKSERRRAAKPKGDKLLATVLKSMNDSIQDNASGTSGLHYDWASELLSEELMETGNRNGDN